jgi:hypothetical protein
MKNLMRVISILLAFVAVLSIIAITFDVGNDFYIFYVKVLKVFSDNVLPIISIAACAYCLERNDTNYIVRIIPLLMAIPILVSIIIALFDITDGFLIDFYDLIGKTFISFVALSIVLIIKPNNQITKIISYITYGLIFANFLLPLFIEGSLSSLSSSSYSLSIGLSSAKFLYKMYAATLISEIFAILLLYITNYAFSDKIELEAEDIDYEAVKEDAMNAANAQMNSIYNKEEKQEVIDRSASEKGLMNVNNQLGQNSNVGNVKTQAKEMNVIGSSLDSLVTLSSGPVINNAAEANKNQTVNNVQEEQIQQTTPAPTTTPPNVDIQEEMKRKLEQASIQQTIPQAIPQQQNINQGNIQQQAPTIQNNNQ